MFGKIITEKLLDYAKADNKGKTAIVSSICEVTGMHRKSVIRALSRQKRQRGVSNRRNHAVSKLGRPRKYSTETDAALAFVWEAYNHPCAERLIDELDSAVSIFKRDRMWHYSDQATKQLLGMSLGSMKLRTVAMAKQRGLMRGLTTTQTSSLLRSVPVFFGSWDKKGPGYGQVDTVVHSGPKLMGVMAYTVNYVDVATYWQEPVAQLDKTELATVASLQVIGRNLPWVIKGLHPDSGSEFINTGGINWCKKRGIELTRSRPSKKNDNCYIEQRNDVVVRKYIGYERYDCREAVAVMNELYATLRLYLNFFQATYKLQRKEKRIRVIDGKQAAKPYKRIYDVPKTPYKRALGRGDIDQAVKDRLTRQYETLNPKVLLDKIQGLTTKLERMQREQGYHF
jgi:transposase InsO family protein